jgi:DNA-binding CsgD family transcriptional regulator/catechol 2,3-dioxygenase-like lactoylglutathione lyase family enzyme
MAHPYQRVGRPRHPDILTPAEWRILAGLRDGHANAEIASSIPCSVETVRFHLRNVRDKLGLRSRQALRDWPGRPVERHRLAEESAHTWRIREQIPLIAVGDMPRSLAFYVDLLGMEVVSCWPDAPAVPGWAALGAAAARLMLHDGHHRREAHTLRGGGSVTLTLYVDGLDALHAGLSGAGWKPSMIERMPYGARECYLSDPDGNELALVEFAASDPGYTIERHKEESDE